MKMIVVAAGQGKRLRPLTDNKPKCMVEYDKKPIINHILDTANNCNIKNIAIINGYKKEVLENHLQQKEITFYTNKNFDTTNMLSSFFCAKEFMDDDLIVSYADIIYKKDILEKLISSDEDFSVIVDRKWKELWYQRMENPLDDAETLKIKNNNIIELGKKPKDYNEIEGQYIGLFKISKNVINQVISYYESLDKKSFFEGNSLDNMYMTTFIQMIIDNLLDVKPVYIYGGWIEIDSVEDLNTHFHTDKSNDFS